MIAHVGLIVSDIEKSKNFYRESLKPIGYELLREYGVTDKRPAASAGFGEPPRAYLWIYQGNPGTVTTHLAFQVNKRALVDAFYHAAMAAGGLRPQYSQHYYGAFVLDPDGYNIEAVCREPV